MAEKLTMQQEQAVHNRGGKLLVSAAAGSGKTKVLVDRLMSYVLDDKSPCNVDDFLIITYTKAAAAELRGKISKKINLLIAEDPSNQHLHHQLQRLYLAKISTVHSFCSDILREYAYRMDIPGDFRVADQLESDQLQLQALEYVLNAAYETAGEDACFRAFIDSQGFGRNDRQIPQILLSVYRSAACHLNPTQWLQECVDKTAVEGLQDASETTWGSYLLADLKTTVGQYIHSLEECVKQAEFVNGFEKPCALLKDTIHQLEALLSCSSWDAVSCFGGVDYGRISFPKNCADPSLAEKIKAVRNACKDGIAKKLTVFKNDSGLVTEDLRSCADAVKGLVNLVIAFQDRYRLLKRKLRVLDFTDLEQLTLDLLVGKNRASITSAANEIASRFREIMVDEYQDSNSVQDAIFRALSQKRNNCFMVGDVKQSIYQFRLADPGIFIEKYNSYVDAENAGVGVGRKVLLSSNFRSSGGVISAVNHVFSSCMCPEVGGLEYGPEEMLREGLEHIPLNEPEVELYGIDVEEDTYGTEAAFVAKRIQELLDGKHMVREGDSLRPITPADIVILLRSPGSVGGEYQYALSRRGIACDFGNGGNLLASPDITTLVSILQVIDNPLQDIPVVSALMSPVFAFTADDMGKLRSSNRKCSIYQAVKEDNSKKSRDFVNVIGELRRDARLSSVSELINQVIKRTNLLCIYESMPLGKDYSNNLYRFCQLASDFEQGSSRDLGSFLHYLDVISENGLADSGAEQKNGCVTIMSIHKSKGLEFPVVFLCGLSRRFNEESTREQVLCHKDLGLGLSCVDHDLRVRYPSVAKAAIAAQMRSDGVSEELRVLYVAMTRAKDRLIMTYAAKGLQKDLVDIAHRMACTPKALMSRDVSCPGEWVLQAAMRRTEAGELFSYGSNPGIGEVFPPFWKIKVVQQFVDDDVIADIFFQEAQDHTEMIQKIQEGLRFSYPWLAATQVPSKLTATQMKGRHKDHEVYQDAQQIRRRNFSIKRTGNVPVGGKDYGTVMHLVLQHLDFQACLDEESIRAEGLRLVQQNILTREQYDAISFRQITAFFQTPVGQKLRAGGKILREFKFSVLMDASRYNPDLQGERVLLQGVVDCAIIEDDGIVIIDFKTDRVDDDTLNDRVAAYTPQVQAYADAMAEIYGVPVKKTLLYFLRVGRFVEIS